MFKKLGFAHPLFDLGVLVMAVFFGAVATGILSGNTFASSYRYLSFSSYSHDYLVSNFHVIRENDSNDMPIDNDILSSDYQDYFEKNEIDNSVVYYSINPFSETRAMNSFNVVNQATASRYPFPVKHGSYFSYQSSIEVIVPPSLNLAIGSSLPLSFNYWDCSDGYYTLVTKSFGSAKVVGTMGQVNFSKGMPFIALTMLMF